MYGVAHSFVWWLVAACMQGVLVLAHPAQVAKVLAWIIQSEQGMIGCREVCCVEQQGGYVMTLNAMHSCLAVNPVACVLSSIDKHAGNRLLLAAAPASGSAQHWPDAQRCQQKL